MYANNGPYKIPYHLFHSGFPSAFYAVLKTSHRSGCVAQFRAQIPVLSNLQMCRWHPSYFWKLFANQRQEPGIVPRRSCLQLWSPLLETLSTLYHAGSFDGSSPSLIRVVFRFATDAGPESKPAWLSHSQDGPPLNGAVVGSPPGYGTLHFVTVVVAVAFWGD